MKLWFPYLQFTIKQKVIKQVITWQCGAAGKYHHSVNMEAIMEGIKCFLWLFEVHFSFYSLGHLNSQCEL